MKSDIDWAARYYLVMRPAARDNLANVDPGEGGGRPQGAESLPLKARRHPFVPQLERGLRRAGLPMDQRSSRPCRIPLVVGVSGGADSLALLLGCVAISRRSKARVRLVPIVCHVHHHLRATADADAEFVADMCVRLGLQFCLEHVQPSSMPGNIASNARRLRYEALQTVAQRTGAAHVAVAHHAEDQLETILMALCRGAGPDGIAGMPWSRRLDDSISLVRPLLSVRKTECEEFCRVAGIRWREDPSNADATKARARLRREVLPVLESLWPDAARRASATADMFQTARDALSKEVELQFGPASQTQWERRRLVQLPLALIAAGLRRAALTLAPETADELAHAHAMQVAEAIQSNGRRPRRFAWPGGLTVHVTSKAASMSPQRQSTRRQTRKSAGHG